ncbi:hypothetical protein [Rickettsia endosymbiont of Gonocerus acuteangulatus]
MTFMYIFAHSAILRRKRRGIYPKEINIKAASFLNKKLDLSRFMWIPASS